MDQDRALRRLKLQFRASLASFAKSNASCLQFVLVVWPPSLCRMNLGQLGVGHLVLQMVEDSACYAPLEPRVIPVFDLQGRAIAKVRCNLRPPAAKSEVELGEICVFFLGPGLSFYCRRQMEVPSLTALLRCASRHLRADCDPALRAVHRNQLAQLGVFVGTERHIDFVVSDEIAQQQVAHVGLFRRCADELPDGSPVEDFAGGYILAEALVLFICPKLSSLLALLLLLSLIKA